MANRVQIMAEAYKNDYRGSITALFEQADAEEAMNMPVAETPEQQQQGLIGAPIGSSMMFPGAGGKSFHTVGMSESLDIVGKDVQGNVVQSYMNTPPGIGNLPMSPKVENVIETPSSYQTGGVVNSLSDRIKGHKYTGGRG